LWRPDDRRIDLVRSTMLSLLSRYAGHNIRRIQERVRFAGDMETLWYLRQDLVLALAELEGDTAARDQVRPMNALFSGCLPAALGPRRHRCFAGR
jgi:hypothetical protein